MGDNDGYHYDPTALTEVAAKLAGAGDQLKQVTAKEVTAPDAGASSGVISQAIADLIGAAIGASVMAGDMAGNVHVANGGYASIENDATGAMKRQVDVGMRDYSDMMEHYNGPPS